MSRAGEPGRPEGPDKDRFWEILDQRAGLDDTAELTPEQADRELEQAEPLPLSADFVDRTLHAVRKAPAPRTRNLRQWWLWAAAVIPLGLLVWAGMAPFAKKWPGYGPTSYEFSMEIVCLPDYTVTNRRTALGRVYGAIKRAILALQDIRSASDELAPQAQSALDRIAEMARNPNVLKPDKERREGTFEETLLVVGDRSSSLRDRQAMLESLLQQIRTGITVIHGAADMDEGLGAHSQHFLGLVAKYASQPPK